MERTRVGFGVVFVLLLLLASEAGTTMAAETQGIFRHPCTVASKRYKGICVSDHVCAGVCKSEGHMNGGECEGARRRCLCSVRC